MSRADKAACAGVARRTWRIGLADTSVKSDRVKGGEGGPQDYVRTYPYVHGGEYSLLLGSVYLGASALAALRVWGSCRGTQQRQPSPYATAALSYHAKSNLRQPGPRAWELHKTSPERQRR